MGMLRLSEAVEATGAPRETIRRWARKGWIIAEWDCSNNLWIVDERSLREYIAMGIIRDKDGKAWMELWHAARYFHYHPRTIIYWDQRGKILSTNEVISTKRLYCPQSIQAHIAGMREQHKQKVASQR